MYFAAFDNLKEQDFYVCMCLTGEVPMDELTMERAMEALERKCHDNMNHAIETEEGLGIEYDEDVICDVCRSPDSEEGNDMVFCDKCNICVHQVRDWYRFKDGIV